MTDNELIATIESKLPDELSLEELELLRRRVRESPAAREAVAAQIELHESLAAIVGRIELPADKILAKACRARRLFGRGLWAWFGLSSGSLLLAAIGFSLLHGEHGSPSPGTAAPPAKVLITSAKTEPPASAASASRSTTAPQSVAGEQPTASADRPVPTGGETVAHVGSSRPQGSPDSTQVAADGGAVGNASDNAAPSVQQPVWQSGDQLAGPPHPWNEAALESVGANLANDSEDTGSGLEQAPSIADLRQWFDADSGSWKIETRGRRASILTIEGVARFRGPWSDDSVLRLSLVDCVPMAIHFWNGSKGLSLRLDKSAWSLTAYGTERDGDEKIPQRMVTLATDDRRNWNTCGGKFPLRFDLRFHGGEFTVSRGEIVLLRAPFDRLPTETYFDGRASIAGLDMVRVDGAPPTATDSLPIVRDIVRPADLDWRGSNLAMRMANNRGNRSNMIPPVQFNKLADGSVELKSDDEHSFGADWVDLPNDGLYEIDLELDHLTPGTRVLFGGPGGQDSVPLAAVGFFRDARTALERGGSSFPPLPAAGEGPGVRGQNISCRLANLYDPKQIFEPPLASGPCAFAAPHQWIRIVGGSGLTRIYGGVDGSNWARFGISAGDIWAPPVSRIGLCCMPGDAPRSIVLRRIRLREFHELAQLAPADLIRRAPSVLADDFTAWRSQVERRQPPGLISASGWQRACALRTVLGNCRGPLGRQLLAMLFADALTRPIDAQRRLRLVYEIAALSDVYSDTADANNLVTRFELLGEQLVREQYPAPWTSLHRAVLDAPIWSQGIYATAMPSLAQAQILQSVYSNRPRDVLHIVAQLRLMHFADRLTLWAQQWAAAQADSSAGVDAVADRVSDNPLVDTSDKDAFNTLSDFASALDSRSYHDACQIMTSSETGDPAVLVQDPRDPQLLVSLDTAFSAALFHRPELRETMNRQFAAVGMLLARRAIDRSDADTLAAIAARYRGTPAAAEACLWLGDRATGGGQFNQARSWYRQAVEDGGNSIATRAAPRDRLAAAMLGQDAGSPATEPVQLGEVNMSAEQFESLVAEMRQTHAAASDAFIGVPGAMSTALRGHAVVAVPPPAPLEVRQAASFDGDIGRDPEASSDPSPSRSIVARWLRSTDPSDAAMIPKSPEFYSGLDWAGRQLAIAAEAERLYASNRFQVVAYDAKDGHSIWRSELAGEHGRTHDWTMLPMRPLPVGPRVFVRRLTRSHVELAALAAANGAVLWRSSPALTVVSDPLWIGGELTAICASRGSERTTFSLATFDPADGSLLRSQTIAALRNDWWNERTCQLTQAGDELIAVVCGAVVCCDTSGKPRWIRRQTWLSPQEDAAWARQSQSPPLVVGTKLLVTQPGVMAVECLDLHDGSLVWRSAMPGIQHTIGTVGDSLLTQTDYGIAALSITSGKQLWYHPAADILEGQLCGAGRLMFTCSRSLDGSLNNTRPMLIWLDAANGREIARQSLDALPQDYAKVGPMIAAGNHFWFFAGNENEPSRMLFELRPRPSAVGLNNRPPRLQARAVGQSF